MLWLAAANCAVSDPYVAPAGLTASTGATLRLQRKEPDHLGGTTELDIYRLDRQCPDLTYRLASQGYLGSAPMDGTGYGNVVIPAEPIIVLKLSWSRILPHLTQQCEAALAFRPERGRQSGRGMVPRDGWCTVPSERGKALARWPFLLAGTPNRGAAP
jgi:hypothetical protein